MLDDIIELHRAGRLVEAEAGYRDLLLAAPDDAEALHLLGILRAQRSDHAEAFALVQRAIELDGEHAVFRHTMGEMRLRGGDLDAAEAAYSRARELNPNLTSAHTGLGQIAFLRGKLDEAESHFRIALRADENDAQSLAGLGNIALARDDREKASRYLNEAAKLTPNDALIQGSFASAMMAMETPDFAVQAANNALALKPDYALARQALGSALLSKGDLAGAREAFETLLAQGEQLSMAHLGLGDIARMQARYDEATEHYERALQHEPLLHPAANRRADALARSGRVEQAIAALRERAAEFPDAPYVKVALASLLDQRNRRAEALALWREAAALLPGDADVQASLALALDQAGEYEAALQQAQRVPRDSPRPPLMLMRARAALRGGEPQAALENLRTLDDEHWNEKPRFSRARWKLTALAHDALEQWREAVEAFAHTLDGDAAQLPELGELDDALTALLNERAAETPLPSLPFDAPILLGGLPGCGVGRLAALLGEQPGIALRHDRFRSAPDFISARFEQRLLAPLNQTDLALLQRRYARALQRTGAPVNARVVDRLPFLDARVLPAVKRALPGVRIVLVRGDTRDALLNWLAFGGNAQVSMRDPLTAARWLKRAAAHCAIAAQLLPACVIENTDALIADPDGRAARELAGFLGLDTLRAGDRTQALLRGRNGLPVSFTAGHAVRYEEALAQAFTALE